MHKLTPTTAYRCLTQPRWPGDKLFFCAHKVQGLKRRLDHQQREVRLTDLTITMLFCKTNKAASASFTAGHYHQAEHWTLVRRSIFVARRMRQRGRSDRGISSGERREGVFRGICQRPSEIYMFLLFLTHNNNNRIQKLELREINVLNECGT